MADADIDSDAQDRAEVLDETHLTDDGEDIANFDEIVDVLDVTRADGDADEDEFDEDELDEDDLEEDDELDYHAVTDRDLEREVFADLRAGDADAAQARIGTVDPTDGFPQDAPPTQD